MWRWPSGRPLARPSAATLICCSYLLALPRLTGSLLDFGIKPGPLLSLLLRPSSGTRTTRPPVRSSSLWGADSINTFTAAAGLKSTAFVYWGHGGEFYSSDYPGRLDGENYTTVRDLVTFYSELLNGTLLEPSSSKTLIEWLNLAPADSADEPWASTLGNLLPANAQGTLLHKAGWLPAGCCANSESIVVDAGAVYVGDDWYTIAVWTEGSAFGTQVEYMGWASCAVYQLLSGETQSWHCSNADQR